MEIEIAKNIGFCFGVKRAVQMVENNLSEMKKPVRMYGNIVHNEEVAEKFTQKGIDVVNNLDKIKEGTLIITAHGVSPEIKEELKERKNLNLIDTTCPIVGKVQNLARDLFLEGRQVLIMGDENHSEVKGICGQTENTAIVFFSSEELDNIEREDRKYGLIVQTTRDFEKFREVEKKAKQKFKEIKIFDTICGAVKSRQKEVKKIAQKNDIVFVIGSKKSSNTSRLFEISSSVNKKTYFVANKEEIKEKWLNPEIKIGLISGTSTPNWIIKDIKKYLMSF